VRSAIKESGLHHIDVASSCFTFEELSHLKRSFLRIRDPPGDGRRNSKNFCCHRSFR
jgi:hypothetical protein